MIAARVLPREEWGRLQGDEPRDLLPLLPPENVVVVVVEEDGRIVAHLAVFRITHLDTFWMDPEKAGNAGVTRALLRAATEKAREWDPRWAYINADSEATCETVRRLGGQMMPMHTFLLPLQRMEMEEAACQS